MAKAFSFTTNNRTNVTAFRIEDMLLFSVIDLTSGDVTGHSVRFDDFVKQLSDKEVE